MHHAIKIGIVPATMLLFSDLALQGPVHLDPCQNDT